MKLGRTRRIHFVGIGGIGMSGIAELLLNLGYEVSGSDVKLSAATERLARMGACVFEGHDARHVGVADVVVVSSAVASSNPEMGEALRRRIPVIPRAEMLGELLRLRYGIAVAGAHGKTTTTSMIAFALERAGLDPTAVIGGRVSAFGSNARLGRGDVMVVEADESDGSFLKLAPSIAVITNVDREHLDHYGDFGRLQAAFVEFANRVPFHGAVVVCADDAVLSALVPGMTRRVVTYGLDAAHATVRGRNVALAGWISQCDVFSRDAGGGEVLLGTLQLRVPGRHNLLNALAAVGVGLELGVPFDRMAAGLEEFTGAERRFQVLGETGGVLLVDDYGHHPTEIRSVLAAARGFESRRILVVFQPHRYSRTAALLDEFAEALAEADELVLTDIYAAHEPARADVSIELLADAIRRRSSRPLHIVKSLDAVPEFVAAHARSGDLVVTLGAGSIGGVGARLLQLLGESKEADRR
ncbi:MAG: UDP-N-acetylmuramate--L-alanine ligase [Vicinamibacterales bacterium]